jgi:hypothetical protein
MLVVVNPGREEILALQDAQDHYYHSIAAPDIFRRDGLISVRSTTTSKIGEVDLRETIFATRDSDLDATSVDRVVQCGGAFEGPLANSVADALGLHARIIECDSVIVRSPNEGWNLRRPQVSMGAENRNVQHPARWAGSKIRVQVFEEAFEEILLEMELADGSRHPALFRHRGVLILSIPLFDLVAEHFSVPPLVDRMNSRIRMSRLNELCSEVIQHFSQHFLRREESSLLFSQRWPNGYSSAFTVRHDYDRPISDRSLKSLLDLYDRLKIKCSIGFLAYSTPENQIREFVRRGHEIQIHAFEADAPALTENVAKLSAVTASRIDGVTVHGGSTSIGFHGDMHYDWFERAGLRYAECFSFDGYPAPIYRPDAFGVLHRSPLMGTMMHYSFDPSTRPDDHRLAWMRERVPQGLQDGHGVIAMNHPDIHRPEFTTLLEELVLTGAWRTTLGKIVEWERATKYDISVEGDADSFWLKFLSPLPEDAVIHLKNGLADVHRIVVPKGTSRCYIRRDGSLIDGLVEPRRSESLPAPQAAAKATPSGATANLRMLLRESRDGVRQMKRAASRAKSSAARIFAGRPHAVDVTIVSKSSSLSSSDSMAAGVKAAAKIVLQRAGGDSSSLDLTALVAGQLPWPTFPPVIGHSIVDDLPNTLGSALARVVQNSIPCTKAPAPASSGSSKSASADAEHLARWFVAECRDHHESEDGVQQGEWPYFLASTGTRTAAVIHVLREHLKRPLFTLVDHGTCFGLMPWLIAAEGFGLRRAVLIDPLSRYEKPMRRLWAPFVELGLQLDWEETCSETYEYGAPADAILFSHTLFRIPRDERQAVLNRAWDALSPGGILIVNETVTNIAPSIPQSPDVPELDTLVAYLSWASEPKLYRIESGWRVAEPAVGRTAAEFGSTSVLLAIKPKTIAEGQIAPSSERAIADA